MGNINNCSFKNALWFGGVKEHMPMRVYIHGEYRDRNNADWLRANKGDTPGQYTFGVKREDIVWIEDWS
jgi:hypothetical protein